jgi:hypothetical protein
MPCLFSASCNVLTVDSGKAAAIGAGGTVWANAAKFGERPVNMNAVARTAAPRRMFFRWGRIVVLLSRLPVFSLQLWEFRVAIRSDAPRSARLVGRIER